MKSLASLAIVLALVLAASARAADSPAGNWTWTVKIGDNSFDAKLKLNLENDKLTGAMSGGPSNQETPITNGSFKDGTVSFAVVRERDGQKMTIKYTGKLSGDTITGTSERQRDGQKQSSEWIAKRQK